MRILFVDDEPELREQISNTLTGQKYTVDTSRDGAEALERIFTEPYDLIILDVMLPRQDGFEVLRELRAEKITTPVLLLTARGEVENRIKGLDLGADDYLAKPFSIAELLARIRALLRRSAESSTSVLEINDVRIDTASRQASRGDLHLNLTPKEFSLLEFLLYNRNRAISRFSLAEHVWGDAFDPFTMSNNIDVHIKNLRRKIGDDQGTLIRTVRGVGYMITDSEQ
ncbi:MAG TPA: response regulator transcription factor [Desulfobacteraceae bacterium]|nr:response regulator transcription factor [Desulfobacteraceae bacterium]